jgi:signal transduction histidine kinase
MRRRKPVAERRSSGRAGSDGGTSDLFARAQWRLALLFTGIVIILVVLSGFVSYYAFRQELRAAAQRGGDVEGETEQEYVQRTLVKVRWQVLAIDGVVIVLVGVGGLLFARRTLRPIRDNVAAQRRFIADASHDLRTPLAVMKTDFEVNLRDPGLAAAARPVLESGLEEVDRMSEMVEDLLMLSRMDAHQEQVLREPLDVAAVVRGTTEQLAKLAATDQVSVGTAGADDRVMAIGDERHLRRALANVLKNAIEHSPSGGTVEVVLGRRDGTVEVVVKDQGPGIPPDEIERVFDRFYRSDPARSRETGGTGLGLAISRWALRQMRGDVTIRSDPGGTAVRLTLPAARAEPL